MRASLCNDMNEFGAFSFYISRTSVKFHPVWIIEKQNVVLSRGTVAYQSTFCIMRGQTKSVIRTD